MIVILLAVIGAVIGGLTARKRNGNRKDIAQYAAGFAMAFIIVGIPILFVLGILGVVFPIIGAIKAAGVSSPEELVEATLEHMGFLEVGDETMVQLLDHAKSQGDLNWTDEAAAGTRVGEMLALVGATTEYQFG